MCGLLNTFASTVRHTVTYKDRPEGSEDVVVHMHFDVGYVPSIVSSNRL